MSRASQQQARRGATAGWLALLLLLVPTAMLCHALLTGMHSDHSASAGPAPMSAMADIGESALAAHSPETRSTGSSGHQMTVLAVVLTTLLILAFASVRLPRQLQQAARCALSIRPASGSRAPPIVLFPSLLCVLRT